MNTITVQQPDQAAMTRSAGAALAMVESFDVVDVATFELAADELVAIKRKAAQLEEQRRAITRPLDDAKTNVMSLFKPPIEVLQQAESILKSKMLNFQQAEQRRAAEARAAAEAAAQAERERLASEARQLAAEGRAGEAAIKAQVADLIIAATPAVEVPKAAGISTRTTVDFEVVDLLELVAHVAQHPELIALLQPDTVKLRAYVKGLGTACQLPGVRVFEKAALAARK